MGAPMAANLLKAGCQVVVHNRTRSKEEPLAALGATRAADPAAAAREAEIVLTCVSDTPDVESGVYPGFPTPFCGLSGFCVGDSMGKSLWKLVENTQRFPRRGGRVLCVHGAVSFHRARPCATR